MSTTEALFGPLSRKYCDYFYVLQVIGFALTMFMVFIVIRSLFSKKPMSLESIVNLITGPLLVYFINRLYYSMCVKSLH